MPTSPGLRTALLDHLAPEGLQDNFTISSARKRLAVTTLKEDCRGAKPLDPSRCVLSKTIRRERGKPALVYRTVTYVMESPRRVVKYMNGQDAKSATKLFDKSSKFPVGVKFEFTAPDAGHQVGQSGSSHDQRIAKKLNLEAPAGRDKVGGRIGHKTHGARGHGGPSTSKSKVAAAPVPTLSRAATQRKAEAAALRRPLSPNS